MFLGFIVFAIGLHAASFFWLRERVRAGSMSRGKAMGIYTLVGLAPTVLFVGLFLVLVGAEEFLSISIISEGSGRGAPIFAGLLLLLWILCSVVFALYAILRLKVGSKRGHAS